MKTSNNLNIASQQWASRPADERFETLAALRASVHGRRMKSRAEDVALVDLKVHATEDGNLLVNDRIVPSAPSHWAFGQMAALVGAPAGYLRKLPAPLAADCLNSSIEKSEREEFKIMTIRSDDDKPAILQAVTSRTYGRIWDADVVDAVERIVERSGGRFFNPPDWSRKPSGLYASDHDVFCFMIDGGTIVDTGLTLDSKPDVLNRGFIVWNSETGARTFGLMTFLFRVVCGNHIIWGAEDVTKLIVKHSSGAPGRFDCEALPALMSYVNASPKPIEEAVKRAKSRLLIVPGEKLDDIWVAGFARTHSFTKGEVSEAIATARKEEGDCGNWWQLIQGFTASARRYEFVDARIDLEKRAGKLMSVVN